MKSITLTQPWATLVAIGAKNIETRSWGSSYRGWLAIHAAKAMPAWAADFAERDAVIGPLARAGIVPRDFEPWLYPRLRDMLPRGAIVAVANLHKVERIRIREWDGATVVPTMVIPAEEIPFGDYTPGRYAWVLTNSRPLKVPIPCPGALSLWTVDPQIEARVREQL